MIGRDLTRDDRLAESRRAFYDHALATVADRIDREHDAALVCLHHLLNDDGHTRIAEHTFLRAVEERARREERRPAFLYLSENRLASTHVQIAFLLARKAR